MDNFSADDTKTEPKLDLLPEHLADWRKSGLSDLTGINNKIRSVPREEMAGILGESLASKVDSLLDIPYQNIFNIAGTSDFSVTGAGAVPIVADAGQAKPESVALSVPPVKIEAFNRYKVFPPLKLKDGTMRYYQKKGSGCRFYVPFGVEQILMDASKPLAFTEGEKKALKITEAGIPCIGLSGLWNFLSEGKPIADFETIEWKDREILLFVDSDARRNDNLLMAIFAFLKEVEKRGAK